jgi:hypothetical protein
MEKVLQPLNEKAASIIAEHIGEHTAQHSCGVDCEHIGEHTAQLLGLL